MSTLFGLHLDLIDLFLGETEKKKYCAMVKTQGTRYGIGEWYGTRFTELSPAQRLRYASLSGVSTEDCPHQPGPNLCNKRGGVCSMAVYVNLGDGTASIDPSNPGLVALCPYRFWQNHTIFKEVGSEILGTKKPVLIKEVGFLRSIDHRGRVGKEIVGRIDMVVARADKQTDSIVDWCALEMQAVYFSGKSMNHEFKAIRENPNVIPFPKEMRRPDFRSSGPKRLMPQLQIKVPTLRRWGKKMTVVVDQPFYRSIAPMKRVASLSNADIAWFVVDYDKKTSVLNVSEIVYTTLESSVEGLTAGQPVDRQEFERELEKYYTTESTKLIRLS